MRGPEGVLKTFLVIDIFHRRLYGPPSRVLYQYITTCDFPCRGGGGGGGWTPFPSQDPPMLAQFFYVPTANM